MKIVHIADVHIDERKTVNGRIITDPGTGLNIRMKDLMNCMEQVVSFARANGCDLFLIAGDVFERALPSPAEYLLAFQMLNDLTSIAPVAIVAGNHDGDKAVRVLKYLPNVHVLEPFEQIAMGDSVVTGVPYVSPKVYRDAFPGAHPEDLEEAVKARLRSLPENGAFNIVLGHTNILSAKTPSGEEIVGEVTLRREDLVVAHYGAWGHIHKTQVIGPVHFPGSLDICDYGEKDEKKGFFHLNTANGKTEFVEVKTRPMRTFHYRFADLPAIPFQNTEDAICKVTVEIGEDDLLKLDRDGLKKLFAGTLDVDVDPQIVHHQRPRAEGAGTATGVMDYLNLYAESNSFDSDKLDRLRAFVRRLCEKLNIPCQEKAAGPITEEPTSEIDESTANAA